MINISIDPLLLPILLFKESKTSPILGTQWEEARGSNTNFF